MANRNTAQCSSWVFLALAAILICDLVHAQVYEPPEEICLQSMGGYNVTVLMVAQGYGEDPEGLKSLHLEFVTPSTIHRPRDLVVICRRLVPSYAGRTGVCPSRQSHFPSLPSSQ